MIQSNSISMVKGLSDA